MKDMATILVVDDEIGIRELLTEILHDEGHIVEIAANAREARDCRLRGAPDLVLLDIWMPDTDGMTLLKEWASQGQLTIPVIMMSDMRRLTPPSKRPKSARWTFWKAHRLAEIIKGNRERIGAGHAQAGSAVRLPKAGIRGSAASAVFRGRSRGGFSNRAHAAYFLRYPSAGCARRLERAYFEYHLARQNGSMTRIAEKAGLERTHLYRKLKHLRVGIHKNKNDDKPGRNRAE